MDGEIGSDQTTPPSQHIGPSPWDPAAVPASEPVYNYCLAPPRFKTNPALDSMSAMTLPDGRYIIRNALNRQVFDLCDYRPNEGNPIVCWDETGGSNQKVVSRRLV